MDQLRSINSRNKSGEKRNQAKLLLLETLGLRFRASVNIESQPPASQVKTFPLDQNLVDCPTQLIYIWVFS